MVDIGRSPLSVDRARRSFELATTELIYQQRRHLTDDTRLPSSTLCSFVRQIKLKAATTTQI